MEALCLGMCLAGLLQVNDASLLPAQGDDELGLRLARVAEASRAEFDVANLVVGLALGGETVFAQGWSYAEPAERVPAAPDSLFRVGALTTPLVTLGVLMLLDEQELALEDPLEKHLAGVELGALSELTVEQLLRHTTGLPAVTGAALQDLAAWLSKQPLEHAPGTCASYSAGNTYWLGRLIESAAGLSVDEFVRSRIAAPLELAATEYCGKGIPVRATAESRLEVAGGSVADPCLADLFASSELCSNASDLLALLAALDAGQLVSEEALQLLQEPDPLPDGTAVTFVGGFSSRALGAHAGTALGGSLAGGSVHAAWYPDIDLALVLLSSDEGAPLALIERRLTRAFLGEVGPELAELELPAQALARYVGGYFVGCLSYRVEARGEELWIVPSGGGALRLCFQGEDSFAAEDDPDVRVTFEVADGLARALVFDEHGFVTVATRME